MFHGTARPIPAIFSDTVSSVTVRPGLLPDLGAVRKLLLGVELHEAAVCRVPGPGIRSQRR